MIEDAAVATAVVVVDAIAGATAPARVVQADRGATRVPLAGPDAIEAPVVAVVGARSIAATAAVVAAARTIPLAARAGWSRARRADPIVPAVAVVADLARQEPSPVVRVVADL